jgi:DNA-binding transcriptional ArsR family regulator
MAYSATVYEVFIASPSDVQTEKDIVKSVVYEWNASHSRTRGIVLQPVEWKTHSVPEMGGRPQALLNKQILEPGDLLVAIFRTRLGTPTGEAVSGTVEEIDQHMKAGKPVMIYFSSSIPADAAADYAPLSTVKQAYRDRGICAEFDNESDFRAKFARHLAAKLNEPYFASPSTADTSAVPTKGPSLRKEARDLLVEASRDPQGHLFKMMLLTGLQIQTNNREFVGADNPRSRAKWEAALRELQAGELIEDSGDGETFTMTDLGYEVAELISGEVKQELEEMKLKILQLLAKGGGVKLSVAEIARSLEENVINVEYHLEELHKAGYVKISLVSGEPRTYLLDQTGRRYLVENKLI